MNIKEYQNRIFANELTSGWIAGRAPMRIFLSLILLCLFHPGGANAAPRTVRLLTVGNSFADNALTYLPQIVEAAGQKLIVARANLGGCSLERHWRHVAAHEADSASKEGSPYSKGKNSLAQLLAKEKWDFITIQQVSIKSHDLSSYYPYVRDLHRYIKERAPDAKIMAHQIWAYHTISKELGVEVVPSGDAMFLADSDSKWGYRPDTSFNFETAKPPALLRQSHSLHTGWSWRKEKDGTSKLRMDGHHASKAGKYLLGCVWFEVFYGTSAVENTFVPEGLDSKYAKFLRLTAHQAVAGLKADK